MNTKQWIQNEWKKSIQSQASIDSTQSQPNHRYFIFFEMIWNQMENKQNFNNNKKNIKFPSHALFDASSVDE